MLRAIVLLYCLNGFACSGIAQNYLRYDVGDGLPSSKVYCLYQSRQDYLWVGSDKGVARFDGEQFITYGQKKGLSNPLVIGIQEDTRHARLWVRTVGELFFYIDLQTDSVFAYPQQQALSDALKGGTILDFDIQGDSAWFVFNLHKNRNNRLHITSAQTHLQPEAGYLAYGHRMPSLRHFAADTSCRQLTFPVFVAPDKMLAIKRDDPRTMMIIDGQTASIRYKTFVAPIRRIFKSRHSRDVWVSTEEKGVFRFQDGDLDQTPQHLFRDVDAVHIADNIGGGYWLSLFNADLLFVPSLHPVHLPQQYIYNVATDAGRGLWINAHNGVFYWAADSDSLLSVGEPQAAVAALLPDPTPAQPLWIGSSFALDRHQRPAAPFFKEPHNIKTFVKTPEGLIWAGLGKGLLCIHPQNNSYERKFKDFNERVNALCWDKRLNKLWVGTAKGLWLLDTQTGLFQKQMISPHFPDIYIKSLQQSADGYLWIGTQGLGLWGYQPSTQQFRSFNTELPQDFINCIYLQHDTAIWVGTNEGCFYKPIEARQWLGWNHRTGIPHNEVTAIAAFRDNIVVGTAKGFVLLPPHPHPADFGYMPPLFLHRMDILGQPYPLHPQHTARREPVRLQYYQNALSFYIQSPSFNFRPHFRYKLEGMDHDWKTTHYGEMHYFGLPPGSYTFWVCNQNQLGDWNPAPVRLSIYIAPHFTQTLWFLIAVVLALVALVSGFIYWRATLWAKRQSMQRRIIELEYQALQSQMNPHFVFNAMQSILALIKTNRKEEAQKYLVKLSKLMRTILEHSFLQFVPLEQEIAALQLYTNLELMRWQHKVTVRWDLPPLLPPTLLPPMLFQPLIENAFVHAFPPKDSDCLLSLSVSLADTHWSFVIQDNGVGRKAAARYKNHAQKSSAIANVQERIQKIEEAYRVSISLVIEDLYDDQLPTGTKITVTLPFKT